MATIDDIPAVCTHPAQAITTDRLSDLLAQENMHLDGWQLNHNGVDHWLEKTMSFANHHALMAFVNAVAWISHGCNHHPEISYTYKVVTLRYSTHDLGGLSWNDVICAQHVNRLLQVR